MVSNITHPHMLQFGMTIISALTLVIIAIVTFMTAEAARALTIDLAGAIAISILVLKLSNTNINWQGQNVFEISVVIINILHGNFGLVMWSEAKRFVRLY